MVVQYEDHGDVNVYDDGNSNHGGDDNIGQKAVQKIL